MTTTLERAPQIEVTTGSGNGGVAARRAVIRWGWRLFRREWRQQLLVLILIVVAVAITIVGAAVSTNSPQPATFGFGTAKYSASVQGTPSQLRSGLSTLQHTYGRLDVIENQTLAVPGSISTFDLRAQNPHGAYGQPMLQLLSGRYPTAPDQVTVTTGVASEFHLKVGSRWSEDGRTWRVVGTVQNPLSLLDEFALVAPGQVSLLNSSTQVTALFDASASYVGRTENATQGNGTIYISSVKSATNSNLLNPETITLTLATVGMLLIGLVAIAGFTVLAQRRLRSIGMLESLGATDANVRLVVRANGAAVGIVGAVLGAVLGFVLWVLYRPYLEQSSHHVIGLLALPWVVVAISLALACITPYLAATRPARTITRVPIVTALSGRPAPPKQVTRSAIPGIILVVIAFFLLGAAGSSNHGSGGAPQLVFGFVALIIGIVLLAPLLIGVMARVGRRSPLSVRLALRDLSRYRARSGAALGAISLGVFIAATICVVASARYANVLDYAGPNVASNQIVVYPPNGNPNGGNGASGPAGPTLSQKTLAADVHVIAKALGSHNVVEMETTSVSLMRDTTGSNNFNGNIFVGTPSLLHAFGISKSEVNPKADFLSMRPGLSGESDMLMVYGNYFNGNGAKFGPGPANAGQAVPCPKSDCQTDPLIQYVPQLPSGTSAPNTVVTEHAISELHLQSQLSNNGWLITAPSSLSAAQLSAARSSAALDGMTVETKNDEPTSSQVIDWATVAGLLLALAILAMTIGLIRSETASDLRTLTATGASSRTRRSITAATAGALALLGAILGTGAGYLAAAAFFRTSDLADQSMLTNISQVPASNLLLILVGMPLVAYLVAYLFAGRQPAMVSRQPIE
jgi:putative ABC transport system permease protein